MDFFFYLLVNANLFLRPAELVPDLQKLPLYYWFILACLFVSIPKLMGLISADSPLRHPVCLCVFGILAFAALSHAVHSDLERLGAEVFDFFKVVIYFVLFLAVVDSPAKLRVLVGSVIVFGLITGSASILQYHDLIQLPNLKAIDDSWIDDNTGEQMIVRRLMLTGILHDPNEFCLFLSVLTLLTLHKLSDTSAGMSRFVWLAPLGLFMYGINLTKSRGGLLALVAGLATMSICKWGVRRTAAIGLLLLPLAVVGLSGRQTTISISSGTGRARLELWSDWLSEFRGSPLVGVGPKIAVSEIEEARELRWNWQQIAHNSYLQAFADLGVIGGMIFLGAFLFACRTLMRYRQEDVTILDPRQRQLYPFLFGALATYMMGMMSLSLCYVLPTYFILAMPVAFARMTATEPKLEPVRFDGIAWRHLATASVCMLSFIYVVMRVFKA